MADCWIRFVHQEGRSTLLHAHQVYFTFESAKRRVLVYAQRGGAPQANSLICTYLCELEDHVTAAESLIMQGIAQKQPLTISAETLEEHAEFLSEANSMQAVLELLHQGQLRFPIENENCEDDLLGEAPDGGTTEIREFEQLLHTYLHVPADVLRQAIQPSNPRSTTTTLPTDRLFSVKQDHEYCKEHGYHEFWVVSSQPDRHYAIREQYQELARRVCEQENLHLDAEDSPPHRPHIPQPLNLQPV